MCGSSAGFLGGVRFFGIPSYSKIRRGVQAESGRSVGHTHVPCRLIGPRYTSAHQMAELRLQKACPTVSFRRACKKLPDECQGQGDSEH